MKQSGGTSRRRLVIVIMAIGVLWTLSGAAAADICAGPSVTLDPPAGAPGDEIDVHGEDFFDNVDCDTKPDPPGEGLSGIDVELIQGDEITRLATVDADDDGRFTVTVTLPATASAGPARVRAGTERGHAFREAYTDFTVTAGATTESLPMTGGGTRSWALLGAILLLCAGAAMAPHEVRRQ